MLSKDTAICIRTCDYSETSQIVTFFTRQTGRLDAIAKGSKRPKSPFDGPVEMFSHGKIAFIHTQNKKLAILTEFQKTSDFTVLSSDLYMLNCALFAAELLNSLTDDYDPNPQLFDSFLQFLKDINASPFTACPEPACTEYHRSVEGCPSWLTLIVIFFYLLLTTGYWLLFFLFT